jgi:uncharacterized membrane protein YdbT with pleckstrin-like domain
LLAAPVEDRRRAAEADAEAARERALEAEFERERERKRRNEEEGKRREEREYQRRLDVWDRHERLVVVTRQRACAYSLTVLQQRHEEQQEHEEMIDSAWSQYQQLQCSVVVVRAGGSSLNFSRGGLHTGRSG